VIAAMDTRQVAISRRWLAMNINTSQSSQMNSPTSSLPRLLSLFRELVACGGIVMALLLAALGQIITFVPGAPPDCFPLAGGSVSSPWRSWSV